MQPKPNAIPAAVQSSPEGGVVESFSPGQTDEFVQMLTESQSALYGYIVSLLVDRTAAKDVLQEVNLTLWRKAGSFAPGTSFLAWGCKVAYFHVLSYRRRSGRDRLVFDDDVLAYFAERQALRMPEVDRRARLLSECLKKLPERQRSLIEARYAPNGSVQRIAEVERKQVGAVSQMLFRIRETLMICVERGLKAEEAYE